MSQSVSHSATVSDDETTQGQVKWFNSSSGYGFITFKDDSDTDKDVFVHHSALKTEVDQYKYLVQGEYVKFTLSECEGHDCQASSVWGTGGKLMCETHYENKAKRQTYSDRCDDDEDAPQARSYGGGRGRGGGGRGGGGRGARDGGGRGDGGVRRSSEQRQMTDEEGNVWTLVPKRSRN